VDEGWTVEEKMEFVDLGGKLMRRMGVEPKIGVLSGGRIGDKGRHPVVDRTLSDAEEVTKRGVALGMDVTNCEILIENAIVDRNFILAPDGISGNLIFRTLHFLGRGKALGAVILNIDRVFIDTSRAKASYVDSIALASALVGKRKV
jgi:predicted methyltransferase MtxX (methanogen marker protein 4)